MIYEELDIQLINPNLKAKTKEEVFQTLGKLLIETGYCKESYIDALIEREKNFPTGINMGDIGIAMPHTERNHVNKEAIAIARLEEPVLFYQMGTIDVEVQAKLIFMLAVQDPEEHLAFLQRLIIILQDQDVLTRLLKTSSSEEIMEIFRIKEEQLSD